MSENTITRMTIGAVVVAVATISGLTYLYNNYVRNKPPTKWKRVGKLVEINCFPIKSCDPVQPMEIDCGMFGVEMGVFRDRAFMIVTSENQFLTSRAQPKLVLIKPQIAGHKLILTAPEISNAELNFDELKNGPPCRISFWDQPINTIDCGDDIAFWLSSFLLGKDCGLRLVYWSDYSSNRPLHKWNNVHNITAKDAGILHDNTSYLLINHSSVDEANKHLDQVVTPLQFRPNFVVNGPEAFEEYNWNWVRIGNDVLLKHVNPCDRCITVNVNPTTGERNTRHEPLQFLKKNPSFMRGGEGVMGTLLTLRQSGRVHVGDAVYVDDKN